MIWGATGNQWLDGWVRQAMNFHSELYSAACSSSPLTSEEVLAIDKLMAKLNKINEKVHKRILKEIKRKEKGKKK